MIIKDMKELIDEVIEGVFVLNDNDYAALKTLSALVEIIKTNGSEFAELFQATLKEDAIELGYCSDCYEVLDSDGKCKFVL